MDRANKYTQDKFNKSKTVINWEVGPRYKCIDNIGKGSYGQVVKAVDRLEIQFDEQINAKRAFRELRILKNLEHPSIVGLLDVVSPTVDKFDAELAQHNRLTNTGLIPEDEKYYVPRTLGHIYLIFEFMDTDLSKIIKSNQTLSDEHVQYILYQIVDAVRYLHSANVIHRDLKPANILVNCADCSIKIADFGLARVVPNEHLMLSNSSRSIMSVDSSHSPYGTGNNTNYFRRMPTIASNSLDMNDMHPHGGGGMNRTIGMNSMSGATSTSAHTLGLASSSLSSNSMSTQGSSNNNNNFPSPPKLQRQLTKHVITRWYRAPEVILSQPYNAAVDIWSIGCIFGELIGMRRENTMDYKKRRPLFPGECCGDLSPDESQQQQQQQQQAQQQQQQAQQQMMQQQAMNGNNMYANRLDSDDDGDYGHIYDYAQTMESLDRLQQYHNQQQQQAMNIAPDQSVVPHSAVSDVDSFLLHNIDDLHIQPIALPSCTTATNNNNNAGTFDSGCYGNSDSGSNHMLLNHIMTESKKYSSHKSQLNLIFSLIGTPSVDKMQHLDVKTQTMLLSWKPQLKRDLKAQYPFASNHCLDLLMSLLQFSPYDRPAPEDILEHPYFEGIKTQGYLTNYVGYQQQLQQQHIVQKNSTTFPTTMTQSGKQATIVPGSGGYVMMNNNSSPGSCASTDSSDSSHIMTPKYPICLTPLNAEEEKMKESSMYIKQNFVQEIQVFSRIRREDRTISL